MGTIPSSGAVAWLPTLPASTGHMAMTAGVAQSLPAVASFGLGVGEVSVPTVPAGWFMGEGLLPVPEKITKKTLNLDFVEMRDLMPENWLCEEEDETKNVLAFPRARKAPLTNILQ